MPYPVSEDLVIDASVLRSAGETEHLVSGACRDFLDRVRALRFGVISSPDLKAERDQHASRYASRWFSNMVATKRMRYVPDPADPVLREHLAACAGACADNDQQEDNLAEALAKDACLIEASNACDKAPITSLDDRMRAQLRACASWVPEVRGIVWVNPANSDEGALAWLDAAAPKEPPRMLVP